MISAFMTSTKRVARIASANRSQRARNASPPARELYVRIPHALPCRARVLNRRRGVQPLSIAGTSDIIWLKIDSILDTQPFAAAVRVQR